jgi:hypothetical protein
VQQGLEVVGDFDESGGCERLPDCVGAVR